MKFIRNSEIVRCVFAAEMSETLPERSKNARLFSARFSGIY